MSNPLEIIINARVRVRRRIEMNGQAIEREADFEGQMTKEFVTGILDYVLRGTEQKTEEPQ